MMRGITRLVTTCCAPALLCAQTRTSLDSLADRTARETARLADRRVAVADGYRRLGTDFPSMGEHWLHPRALLVGALDASRPTLLTYADIGGKPTLLGAGFVLVTRGDSQPVGVPGWPSEWHEHSGLISDESGAAPGRSTGDTHVWVLHVWTTLANPAGRYVSDNWAVPFARVGVTPPDRVDADAGRAFSLSVGGDVYMRGVLTDAGLLTDATRTSVDTALGRARERATAVASRSRESARVSHTDESELRAAWRDLGVSLRAILGARVDPFLIPPHANHGGNNER